MVYQISVLAVALLILSGCSKTQSLVPTKQVEKQIITAKEGSEEKSVKTPIRARLDLNTNGFEILENQKSNIETKPPLAFSFDGSWRGNKTSSFVSRSFHLKQINDSYVKGELEIAFLNTNGKILNTKLYPVDIYIKAFEMVLYVSDTESDNEEALLIKRDGLDSFRVFTKIEKSVFFENGSMQFKKIVATQKRKKRLIQYETAENSVIDTTNNIRWQDSISNDFLKSSYQSAVEYCANVTINDLRGWRLPTQSELKKTYSKKSKSKLHTIFKHSVSGNYWTVDQSIDDYEKAWSYSYQKNQTLLRDKNEKLGFRCLHKGK